MPITSLPFSQRVFFTINRHDPELAETFIRQVDVNANQSNVNAFFIAVLRELPVNTLGEISTLETHMGPVTWLNCFEDRILPLLIRTRFPPLPMERQRDFYRTS